MSQPPHSMTIRSYVQWSFSTRNGTRPERRPARSSGFRDGLGGPASNRRHNVHMSRLLKPCGHGPRSTAEWAPTADPSPSPPCVNCRLLYSSVRELVPRPPEEVLALLNPMSNKGPPISVAMGEATQPSDALVPVRMVKAKPRPTADRFRLDPTPTPLPRGCRSRASSRHRSNDADRCPLLLDPAIAD